MIKDVAAAVLINNSQIFIARRSAGNKLAGKWEFPGGKVDRGETPEQCLVREMEEEFGIMVGVDELLSENIHHYPHGSIRLLAYRARWLNGDISLVDHDDMRWVSADELDQFDFSPADIPFVEKLMRGDIRI